MDQFQRARKSGVPLIGFLLFVSVALPLQAQTNPDSPACQGSTVDLQGAAFAQKSRAFLAELQTAVKGGDKAKIASMVSYPLLVIRSGHRAHIRSKAELLNGYETIFNTHIRQAIAQQSAKCLFGNYQGAMIGSGEVWFSEQEDGGMKIITVNLTAGSP